MNPESLLFTPGWEGICPEPDVPDADGTLETPPPVAVPLFLAVALFFFLKPNSARALPVDDDVERRDFVSRRHDINAAYIRTERESTVGEESQQPEGSMIAVARKVWLPMLGVHNKKTRKVPKKKLRF